MGLNSKVWESSRGPSEKEEKKLRSIFTIKWFLIYALAFAFTGFLLEFRFTVEKDTLRLMITAIIPAFASLLAFLGIFAVFRLQIQENKIRDARDELNALYPGGGRPDYVKVRIHYTPAEKLVEEVNKHLVERSPDDNSWFHGGNREELIKRKNRLEEMLNVNKEVKELMRFPLAATATLILISLVYLSIGDTISIGRFAHAMFLVGFSSWVLLCIVYALYELMGR